MGSDKADEILKNQDVLQMFSEEYEQIVEDRRCIRFDIMRSKIENVMPMPVNLPRVITNILSEN